MVVGEMSYNYSNYRLLQMTRTKYTLLLFLTHFLSAQANFELPYSLSGQFLAKKSLDQKVWTKIWKCRVGRVQSGQIWLRGVRTKTPFSGSGLFCYCRGSFLSLREAGFKSLYKTEFVCPSRSEGFLFFTVRLISAWCLTSKTTTSDK